MKRLRGTIDMPGSVVTAEGVQYRFDHAFYDRRGDDGGAFKVGETVTFVVHHHKKTDKQAIEIERVALEPFEVVALLQSVGLVKDLPAPSANQTGRPLRELLIGAYHTREDAAQFRANDRALVINEHQIDAEIVGKLFELADMAGVRVEAKEQTAGANGAGQGVEVRAVLEDRIDASTLVRDTFSSVRPWINKLLAGASMPRRIVALQMGTAYDKVGVWLVVTPEQADVLARLKLAE